jgi:hypothetical protein
MSGAEPTNRGHFVGSIVINAHSRVFPPAGEDPIHKTLKSRLFFRPTMRPPITEEQMSAFMKASAEEVFEPSDD